MVRKLKNNLSGVPARHALHYNLTDTMLEEKSEMARILAADDDELITAFYTALFSEAGHQVATASDGTTALDGYLEFRPDILVLDVDMPYGGGGRIFNLIRRILQLGKPVIFVTGFPEKARGLATTYSLVSVFQKPVGGDMLLEEVKRLLAAAGTGI